MRLTAGVNDKMLRHGLKIMQDCLQPDDTDGNSSLLAIREPLSDDSRKAAIHDIEVLVLEILHQLVNNQDLELVIPKVTQWNAPNDAEAVEPTQGGVQSGRVRFGVAASQRKFAVIVLLLSRVHQMLSTRSTGTRRQLYYEEVSFLKSQREVDDGVLSVSRILGLPPWHLGLLATAKGLIAGDLTLAVNDGEVINCRNSSGGILIPGDVSAIESIQSTARFILVLEKDTIFQRVLREGVLDRLGPCIIVTGKGYPDVSTRVLLARLEAELKIPMLALVDADPHGVHIMSVYRFGTKTCPLPLRSMRWLGVFPSELSSLGVHAVPLTDNDVALAKRLHEKMYLPAAVRSEVSHTPKQMENFLSHGLKGEIDALIEFSPCYLTDIYLPNKIAAANVL